MLLGILWDKQIDDTFENTQWGKVKQMQPVWLCNYLCKRFEETFENTLEKKQTNLTKMTETA